jgi:ubiquinone/menaquinone biosynthesis C-methylase UbiE
MVDMKMSLVERLRSYFQEPFASVKAMGVAEGQAVADLGSGEGYFTIPAAVIAGPRGVVYSVEPDPRRSARIRERALAEGLTNVRVITSKAEALGEIPSGQVDLAFSAFSAHHFEDRAAALSEISRILRGGGTFYLWDRAPGRVFKWGTRPAEVGEIARQFSKVDSLGTQKTIRARFTK